MAIVGGVVVEVAVIAIVAGAEVDVRAEGEGAVGVVEVGAGEARAEVERGAERIPAGGCCPGPGCGGRVSIGRSHTRRPPTVRVSREPWVVGSGGECNIGNPSDDDMGIGVYVGGSQ